jgi:hypothetical protein
MLSHLQVEDTPALVHQIASRHMSEHACAPSWTVAFDNLLLENCRLLLSRDCVHLAFACRNVSPCEEAPRATNESASHSLTSEAGSSPLSARAASENLCRDRFHVKDDRASGQKKILLPHLNLCHLP